MKLKKLAAALALVAAAPAFASISGGASNNGELFATIYDATDGVSYSLDLGIFVNTFSTDPNATISRSLSGTNWTSFLTAAGTDNLQFAVIGVDTAGGSSAANPKRLYTTVSTATTDILGPDVGVAGGNINSYVTALLNAPNATHTGGSTVNGDNVAFNPNPAYFLSSNMNTFNGVTAAAGWSNNVAQGLNGSFRLFSQVGAEGTTPTEQTTFSNVWTLSQAPGGAWTLNYSAVPEPGSLALMLAGLGAMGFVARRRKVD